MIGEFASRLETNGREQLRRPRRSRYEVVPDEEEEEEAINC
jgi:hypothetical protein